MKRYYFRYTVRLISIHKIINQKYNHDIERLALFNKGIIFGASIIPSIIPLSKVTINGYLFLINILC